jgi:hypothetical protein
MMIALLLAGSLLTTPDGAADFSLATPPYALRILPRAAVGTALYNDDGMHASLAGSLRLQLVWPYIEAEYMTLHGKDHTIRFGGFHAGLAAPVDNARVFVGAGLSLGTDEEYNDIHGMYSLDIGAMVPVARSRAFVAPELRISLAGAHYYQLGVGVGWALH